jgi:hypothetical protein
MLQGALRQCQPNPVLALLVTTSQVDTCEALCYTIDIRQEANVQELEGSVEAIETVIKDRIAEKQVLVDRWRQRKTHAAEREEAALQEVGELELALSVLHRVLGKPTADELFGALDMMRFRRQTVADSCFEIVREKGGTAKVTEIIDILIEAGKLKDDRRIAYGTAVKSMERDERFTKVGRGEYGLAEREDPSE